MTTTRTWEESLKTVPLFSEFSSEELHKVAGLARTRQYTHGETIVREGEEASAFYCLLAGQVEVQKGLGAGRVAILATLGPGEFFGEMAILENYTRSATVVATADTECFLIPGWEMMAIVRNDPEVAVKMLKVMSRRLRKTDQALLD